MRKATIDINGSCNLGCSFCYQDLDGSVLPEDEIFRTADENQSDTVEIGGGEPFLDRRIIRIIRELRSKGKRVHISTNATYIPEGLLDLDDRLREGVQIQVSLHASNAELYKKITGRDLFDKAVENTRRIKPRYSTVVSSAIYQDNFDDVPNIVGLVYSMGIPIRVNLVLPEGNGRNVRLLTERQIDQLRGYLLTQKLSRKGIVDSTLVHVNSCTAVRDAYGIGKEGMCPVDVGTKLYVSPRGERFACEFFRQGVAR